MGWINGVRFSERNIALMHLSSVLFQLKDRESYWEAITVFKKKMCTLHHFLNFGTKHSPNPFLKRSFVTQHFLIHNNAQVNQCFRMHVPYQIIFSVSTWRYGYTSLTYFSYKLGFIVIGGIRSIVRYHKPKKPWFFCIVHLYSPYSKLNLNDSIQVATIANLCSGYVMVI